MMAPPKNAHLREHVKGAKPIAISSAITTVKSVKIFRIIKIIKVIRGAEIVLCIT